MTTEEIKLLSGLVDDGNSMILWYEPKTRIAEKLVSVEFHEKGNSYMAKFEDGRPLWLDTVELSEFLMANRIDLADFS